jgi:HK97 family phage portal protein
MTFIRSAIQQTLKSIFRRQRKLRPGAALPRPGEGWTAPYGLSDSQGDPALMLREFRGWVYKAVNRRAQDVAAALRIVQRERSNEEYEALDRNHPLCRLLEKPNPMQTGNQLFWLAHTHADLCGNAYIIKLPNAFGVPSELWALDPRNISIVPAETGGISHYEYRAGTKKWNIGPEYIIHFRYPNPSDPYYGASPLMAAAIEIDIDNESKRHQKAFLGHNPTPRFAIEADGHLLPATVEDLRDQIKKHHTGYNAGVPLILHQGAKAHALDVRPHEINYIESRKMIRDEIVAVFGVPASVLGISEDVNRSNAESNHYSYALYTLEPLARMWDNALTCGLAQDFGEDLRITHETLVPRNREQDRADTEMLLRNGVVSINEERAYRGWTPLPGGDEATVEQGRVPLQQVSLAGNTESAAKRTEAVQRIMTSLRTVLAEILLSPEYGENENRQLALLLQGSFEKHKLSRDHSPELCQHIGRIVTQILNNNDEAEQRLDALEPIWNTDIRMAVEQCFNKTQADGTGGTSGTH